MNNVKFSEPANPPGTARAEQRCEFCLVDLGGFKERHRSRVSADPDYAAANVAMFCKECRKSKLGRVPDNEYLDPGRKWRRIVYQMFWNSKNADGFWEFVNQLKPFGGNPYDPRGV